MGSNCNLQKIKEIANCWEISILCNCTAAVICISIATVDQSLLRKGPQPIFQCGRTRLKKTMFSLGPWFKWVLQSLWSHRCSCLNSVVIETKQETLKLEKELLHARVCGPWVRLKRVREHTNKNILYTHMELWRGHFMCYTFLWFLVCVLMGM